MNESANLWTIDRLREQNVRLRTRIDQALDVINDMQITIANQRIFIEDNGLTRFYEEWLEAPAAETG